ncbi:anti-sigma factor [Paraburkholderia sp. Tr-20389]|uniref:anti-sigma factor family protein n=1 Tax=Paraburkholderia sp. Tr-20389 TaxID=2703903 RepID=UPI001981C4C7|nr:anti-sigma factor [Paraburkholderia sp. Tr-20389]MBN3752957.1 anti-sigma factor [Paraburkholderia sp. Tr-20389]
MSRTFPPSDTPLTEADMQAFADGNLPADRAARVRKYLGSRPGEAERIAFYRQLNMQMRSVFEGAFPQRAHAQRTNREHDPDVRSATRRFVMRRVGVVLLGVVLAMLAASGWFVASRVSPEMLDAAAVMALMRESGQQVPDASAGVHGDPHAVDLAPLGLKLVAVKTHHPNAFASIDVLDYRNADGEPVVLLSAPAPFAADQPHWTAQRIGHVRLLSWTVDGRRYVIAGRATAHGLMRAADALTSR